MITPEERDLARLLLDELEMQLVDEPQPDRSWRTLGRRLSQSRLWPLRSDRPLGSSLTSAGGLTARVVRQSPDDARDRTFAVTLRPSADGDGVHVAIPHLPAGWEPICIVLATFDWSPFEAAAAQVHVPQTAELSARQQRAMRAGERGEPLFEAATADSLRLGADDGTLAHDEAGEHVVEFTSPDLRCLYHRAEGLVEVAAKLPLDDELHHGVAELSYRNGNVTVVQRQPLVFKFSVLDHWKASARLRVPDSSEDGTLHLGVRPFTDQDLDLLSPEDVTDVLGSRLITSMPLEPVAGGFVFRPAMEHHRNALQDANACWLIRVAPAGKEGDDEV